MADAQVGAILRALAALVPRVRRSAARDVATDDRLWQWLGLDVIPNTVFDGLPLAPPATLAKSPGADALRGHEVLHLDRQPLRFGWLFLCGALAGDAKTVQVAVPLVSRPVTMVPEPTVGYRLEGRGGAVTFGDLAADPPPYEPGWGTDPSSEVLAGAADLRAWVDAALVAAGHRPGAPLVGPATDPRTARSRDELVVVVGCGLYVDEEPPPPPRQSALLDWAKTSGIGRTAMAHVYRVGPPARPGPDQVDDREVVAPLPLTAAQAGAVVRSRVEPVTLLSGAPGNGKSHAVCAIAIDAVTQGRSVLVVTPTPHAADVLGELLARQPGPLPVLFGEADGRHELARSLAWKGADTVGLRALHRLRKLARQARESRRAAEDAVGRALQRELAAAQVDRWGLRLPELRAAAPAAFDPGADLAALHRRLDSVDRWPRGWRRRRLRAELGAQGSASSDLLADALAAAGDVRAELELRMAGGTVIGEVWDALLAAERAERAAEGELASGMARDEMRWMDAGRGAVFALSSALGASRARRRELLARIDARALVRALPLWVGTLRDVDELLPGRPGMFDLVIVDEAVQVDQFRAVGALLRAQRAVVVGDPHQLRHISFIADAEVDDAVASVGLGDLADRLDVRRQAIFDVAAGAAPVTFLDEHHRSVPHLVEFSARRFYDDRIRIATRHPGNESQDAIGVVRVPTVADEVPAVVERVAELIGHSYRSIGAFTPFRSHADAIQAALLERFDPEQLLAHGVRAGTAHSSQGSERDVVVVALGLAADDPPGRWRFAEDPNLFNVLVTRARRHLTVVTALAEGGEPGGIVADYLRHAAVPPAPPGGGPPRSPWIAELAAELERNGVAVRTSYPVGRWEVDLVAGAGEGAVALDCEVHPDGPDAHMARHRTLRLAGWRTLDAFASRWDGDAARAAVELVGALRDQG